MTHGRVLFDDAEAEASLADLSQATQVDTKEHTKVGQILAYLGHHYAVLLRATCPTVMIIQVLFVVCWTICVFLFQTWCLQQNGGDASTNWQQMVAATNKVLQLCSGLLAFLIVFRNKEGYDRWWEGRCLWGALVKHAVELAMQGSAWIPEQESAERVVRHAIVFAYSSKALLRDETLHWRDYAGVISKTEVSMIQAQPGWSPLYSIEVCRACIQDAFKEVPLTAMSFAQVQELESRLSSLWTCLGGCLRLRYTVIPYNFEGYAVTMTWFYLLLLPFALIDDLGVWTLLPSAVISWLMLGIQYAAMMMTDPFGNDTDDLPLENFCETIKLQCCSAFLRARGTHDSKLRAAGTQMPNLRSMKFKTKTFIKDKDTKGPRVPRVLRMFIPRSSIFKKVSRVHTYRSSKSSSRSSQASSGSNEITTSRVQVYS